LLFMAPRLPEAVSTARDMARRLGLRRGAVVSTSGAMVHLEEATAVLAFGLDERIGPMRVNPAWRELARTRRLVVLMLGTVVMPEDLDEDTYLERYADRVGTGLVPVAGLVVPGGAGSDGRCPAVITVPERMLRPWPLLGERERQ
jgi:hypothetical protein